MFYERADLLFKDYEWTSSPEQAKFKGEPDRNLFLRTEGNDVLYIINFICTARKYTSKQQAVEMEVLIQEKMPIGLKSQNSVYAWLQENYHG